MRSAADPFFYSAWFARTERFQILSVSARVGSKWRVGYCMREPLGPPDHHEHVIGHRRPDVPLQHWLDSREQAFMHMCQNSIGKHGPYVLIECMMIGGDEDRAVNMMLSRWGVHLCL